MKMAKVDPSQNPDCQKFVLGDQVGQETRFAKFGADPSTGI